MLNRKPLNFIKAEEVSIPYCFYRNTYEVLFALAAAVPEPFSSSAISPSPAVCPAAPPLKRCVVSLKARVFAHSALESTRRTALFKSAKNT